MSGEGLVDRIDGLSQVYCEDLIVYLFVEHGTRRKVLLGCKLAKHFQADELDFGEDYIG